MSFFITQAVNNFKNETGYTKHVRKQVQHTAPPPPRPLLVRPLHSRQQDPLMANISQPPPTSLPTAAPQVQAAPPAPAAATTADPTPPHAAAAAVEEHAASPVPAPVIDHHSPMHSTSQGEPPPPG